MKLRLLRAFWAESIEELVSTSRLLHDRVAEARITGDDRWRGFTSGSAAYCFRDVHGVYPITKDALAKRTQEYQQWGVEAFARNHRIPIEWPDAEPLKTKKLKKEDYVRPYGVRMERQGRFGVSSSGAWNKARSS